MRLAAVAGQSFLTAVVNDAAALARRRAAAAPKSKAKDAEKRLALTPDDVAQALRQVRSKGWRGFVGLWPAAAAARGVRGAALRARPACVLCLTTPSPPRVAPQYGVNVRPAPYYVNPGRR